MNNQPAILETQYCYETMTWTFCLHPNDLISTMWTFFYCMKAKRKDSESFHQLIYVQTQLKLMFLLTWKCLLCRCWLQFDRAGQLCTTSEALHDAFRNLLEIFWANFIQFFAFWECLAEGKALNTIPSPKMDLWHFSIVCSFIKRSRVTICVGGREGGGQNHWHIHLTIHLAEHLFNSKIRGQPLATPLPHASDGEQHLQQKV